MGAGVCTVYTQTPNPQHKDITLEGNGGWGGCLWIGQKQSAKSSLFHIKDSKGHIFLAFHKVFDIFPVDLTDLDKNRRGILQFFQHKIRSPFYLMPIFRKTYPNFPPTLPPHPSILSKHPLISRAFSPAPSLAT